jgi:hypothetical protein
MLVVHFVLLLSSKEREFREKESVKENKRKREIEKDRKKEKEMY